MRLRQVLSLPGMLLALMLVTVGTASAADEAITTANVNMRAGPGTRYPVIVTIPRDSHVLVHGCIHTFKWCDVSWRDERGWVYSAYLAALYEGSYVTIYEYHVHLNILVIVFSFGDYWDLYYRSYPWYHDRDYWDPSYPPPASDDGTPTVPGDDGGADDTGTHRYRYEQRQQEEPYSQPGRQTPTWQAPSAPSTGGSSSGGSYGGGSSGGGSSSGGSSSTSPSTGGSEEWRQRRGGNR